MKNKKKKKPKYNSPITITNCKGKKGGCYWDGEPICQTNIRIAA